MAEGGGGGNSAIPLQKIEASLAALLVQSRTPQKSFLFLLEEKIRRAHIRKSEENFFAGWRVLASGGGLASLVPFKESSREVYNYSTKTKLNSFLPAKQWTSIAEAHQKIGKTETCLLLVGITGRALTVRLCSCRHSYRKAASHSVLRRPSE